MHWGDKGSSDVSIGNNAVAINEIYIDWERWNKAKVGLARL